MRMLRSRRRGPASLWALGLGLASAMVLFPAGCRRARDEPLTCHVGGTMRPVMQELARIHQKETGVKVEINSAGSGELLAHIESHKAGDLYVCHDPFLDMLMQKFHLGVDGWTVAELTPVIVVQKGNPKKIRGLKDLVPASVELWLTDYEKSTLGHMLKTIFAKAGIDFDKLNEDKTIPTHKGGAHVATLVQTRNADAALCWNAVAHLRRKDLDIIPLPAEHLPTPGVDTVTSATGKAYTLTPVRVTIATLKCSRRLDDAKKFAEFVASDRAAKVFQEFGFTQIGVKKEYDNGRALKP